MYFVVVVISIISSGCHQRSCTFPLTRTIHYRSRKNFDEPEFLNSVAFVPFRVIDIFDEIDDMAWYTSALMRNIIDEYAPVKTRVVKCDSVPYMNSALRKAQYKRNMTRNKFRKFAKQYWEQNYHANKQVVINRKQCKIYFREHDNVETDPNDTSELFNDYFSRLAMGIGFYNGITSTSDAVEKHNFHSCVVEIRQKYGNESTFRFNFVDENCVALILCKIDPVKPQGMIIFRVK